MLNISQSKIAKGKKLRKEGEEADMQGTGDGRFGPPVPFPRTQYFQNVKLRGGPLAWKNLFK